MSRSLLRYAIIHLSIIQILVCENNTNKFPLNTKIKWTEKAIFELTGIKPKYMRPPNGNLDSQYSIFYLLWPIKTFIIVHTNRDEEIVINRSGPLHRGETWLHPCALGSGYQWLAIRAYSSACNRWSIMIKTHSWASDIYQKILLSSLPWSF